jgi:hypothetical protein
VVIQIRAALTGFALVVLVAKSSYMITKLRKPLDKQSFYKNSAGYQLTSTVEPRYKNTIGSLKS